MGDISSRKFSLNNHTLSQQYCDSNNGDVISGCDFLNSHTLYQCEDSIKFKNIYDDVEKGYGDVSSAYGFLNIHNISHCESSGTFKNIYGGVYKGDVRSGYGSTNSYTCLQINEF